MTSDSIGVAGAANYWDGDFVGYPGMALTDVGAYGANSDSFCGTNDQAGNVFEWNDAVIDSSRGRRGGSWNDFEYNLRSSSRGSFDPTGESSLIGFRVASVPEPSAMVLTIFFGAALCTRRKR